MLLHQSVTASSAHEKAQQRPLVVDLDGTLIKSDLLIESFFVVLSKQPLKALAALTALGRGKAAFKAQLAADAVIDCEALPLNDELVALIREEKAKGRPIYLASASDRSLVDAVAKSIGIFDDIFASDGMTNLSGGNKAAALIRAFGEGNFDYAGNSHEDMSVWQAAKQVIVVGGSNSLSRKVTARFPSAQHLDSRRFQLGAYLRALRVHQWLKNLLIFVPAAAAHQFSLTEVLPLVLAFLSFSLCASSAYVANDLLDLNSDRAHARKRYRPLASGRVPLAHAVALVPTLLAFAVVLALLLPRDFLALLGVYYILTTGYSVLLKRKLMIDVIALACLYGMRLAAGALTVSVSLSPWFVAFSVFFFLCLAIIKRCTELIDRVTKGTGDPKGRGYIQRDMSMLEMMAVGTGYVAIMIFALYINSPAVTTLYRNPEYLWAICLVLFYWISRILLLTHRGEMHDDPVVFATTDLKSLVCGALVVIIGALSI
jgi:4-hydroxybenzoate polyprenyltransferase/phosphoserine phosphatase